MAKEDFLSKLHLKDYHKELENLLDKKDFDSNVKNLLLSVLYKMETAYIDYKEIKREVPGKKELFETMIQNVEACNEIVLVEPQSEKAKQWQKAKITYVVNRENGNIESIPREEAILMAVLKLSETKIPIYDSYKIGKEAMIDLLRKRK